MEKEKEVTICYLARKLHLSIATVSRALKDDSVVSKKTRKKIFDLAKEMGYRSNPPIPSCCVQTLLYGARPKN